MRVLVLILLVVAIVWLLRRALGRAERDAPAARPPVEGDLVSCAQCGLHLPRSEAREHLGAVYCTDEHARLGPRGPSSR